MGADLNAKPSPQVPSPPKPSAADDVFALLQDGPAITPATAPAEAVAL